MPVTRETLVAFLTDNFDLHPDDLQDDTPIFSQGLLDSFQLLELVGFLEKELRTKVGAMEVNLQNLDSVERILRYAESKSAV